jgi:hypothetical protein
MKHNKITYSINQLFIKHFFFIIHFMLSTKKNLKLIHKSQQVYNQSYH